MEKNQLEKSSNGGAGDDDSNDTFSFEAVIGQYKDQDGCWPDQGPFASSVFQFDHPHHASPNLNPKNDSPANLGFSKGKIPTHGLPFSLSSSTKSGRDSIVSSQSSSIRSSRNSSTNSRSSSTNSRQNSGNKTKDPNRVRSPVYKQVRFQLVSPPPTLKTPVEFHGRKRLETVRQGEPTIKRQVKETTETSCLARGFFSSFLSACRECHALEPPGKSKTSVIT